MTKYIVVYNLQGTKVFTVEANNHKVYTTNDCFIIRDIYNEPIAYFPIRNFYVLRGE